LRNYARPICEGRLCAACPDKLLDFDTTLAASERAAYHAQKLRNPSSLKVLHMFNLPALNEVTLKKKAGRALPDRRVNLR
jgi:hypothetical protein